jgi:hypothetical protein
VGYPESDSDQNSEPSHGQEDEEEPGAMISLHSFKNTYDISRYGPSVRTSEHIQALLDRHEAEEHKDMDHEMSMGGAPGGVSESEAEQDLEQELEDIFQDQGTSDVRGTHIWRLADDVFLEELKRDGFKEVFFDDLINSGMSAVEGDAMNQSGFFSGMVQG